MPCVILPIKKTCVPTIAGIRKLYVVEASKVDTLVVAADGQISAITMKSVSDVFVPFEFKLHTAFFNQDGKRANGRGAMSVKQAIQFNIEGLSVESNKALNALNACNCGLHAIVVSNTGDMQYAGISIDKNNKFVTEEMRTGDGFAHTGANPESDESGYQVSIECSTRHYAPFVSILESAIPIA
jgi:hypothetical protein